ncbi:1,6-anhydro-N-acetylmuramyl-L-alanine amidase AmpD [Aeromonas caviae]|nr:1,6-anhydro-N-acetylmuramyl-L-alanine amidase AmpD [Aeromonas caviae]
MTQPTTLFSIDREGWCEQARKVPSPHHNERLSPDDVSLLVIHGISLPPGQFGGPFIDDLFLGRLDPGAHPYFAGIHQLRVSAHCLIRRDGELVQYVPFGARAWHAGVSSWEGREACNDFSIGIELEGTDELPYSDKQYEVLSNLSRAIVHRYPAITANRIVGHCDIAPGRKTDPGDSFEWPRYREKLHFE